MSDQETEQHPLLEAFEKQERREGIFQAKMSRWLDDKHSSETARERREAPGRAMREMRADHGFAKQRAQAIEDYLAIAGVMTGRARTLAELSAKAVREDRDRWPRLSPHQLLLRFKPLNVILPFRPKLVVSYKSGLRTRRDVLEQDGKARGPSTLAPSIPALCGSCGHRRAWHGGRCNAKHNGRKCKCQGFNPRQPGAAAGPQAVLPPTPLRRSNKMPKGRREAIAPPTEWCYRCK